MEFTDLGDLIKISKGKKHEISEDISESSIRIIGIEDLRSDKSLKYTNDRKGVEIEIDDLLIAWDGSNAGTVGFGKKGFAGSTISRLRIKDKTSYSTLFLGHLLKTKSKYLRENSNGAAIPHVSKRVLESILIPIIDIESQHQIGYLLNSLDGLIAERNNHLQQLDVLLKSIFFDMFENTDNLEWPIVEIRSLASDHRNSMRTGPFGSNLLHSEFIEDGDVVVLGIDNAVKNCFSWGEKRYITNEKYIELKNYQIYPEDVIITIMGTIGRSAVVPKNIPLAINTKHLAAITLNRDIANPYFISYSFHSNPYIVGQMQSRDRGAIMSGLNLGIIKSLKIRRPPIDLQDKFANILQHVDHIRSQYQSSLTELESLYGVLSQRAFKGELDLSRVPLQDGEPEAVTTSGEPQPAPFEDGLPDLPGIVADLNAFNTGIQAIGPALAALRASSAQMEVMNLLLEVSSPAEQWQRLPRVVAALQSDASTQDMPAVAEALAAGQTALDKAQAAQIIALPGAEAAFQAMQQTFRDAQQQFPLYLGHTEAPDPTEALQETQPVPEDSVDEEDEAVDEPVIFTKAQVLEAVSLVERFADLGKIDGTPVIEGPYSTEKLLRFLTPLAKVQIKSYEFLKSMVYELLDSGELVQALNKETKILELRLRQ